MKLIIGLGNPGSEYTKTRHNVGFLIVEDLANELGGEFRKKTAMQAEIAEVMIEGEKVLLAKPQTFMNASGKAVKAIMDKSNVEREDLLVVYDDADLEFGDVRFREGGGSAGHNGLQSILELFPKSSNVARLRIGIGRPDHPDIPLEDFVLAKWTEKEEGEMPGIISAAKKEILTLLHE